MAKTAVTTKKLLQVEGIEDVMEAISKRISEDARIAGLTGDNKTGLALKQLFLDAAKPVQDNAQRNIDGLPISGSAKNVLKSQVVRGRGPQRFKNAFVAMYQWAATKGQGSIPNPYWFEFGTKPREGPRGQMTPTPFFRPAVTASRGAVRAALVDGLKRILVDGEQK